MPNRNADSEPDDERVSLAPLDPVTALRALLRVDPKSEPVEQDAPGQQEGQDKENGR